MNELRNNVAAEDLKVKENFKHESQRDVSKGYGGKFLIDKDRVDKSAHGYDFHEQVEKHASQKGQLLLK